MDRYGLYITKEICDEWVVGTILIVDDIDYVDFFWWDDGDLKLLFDGLG